ncbi:hypothetical protein ATY75_03740 [Rhizobium sp. N122]|nr:hypothetical protein ATY75_03740 [Rhizobium sp. N122]
MAGVAAADASVSLLSDASSLAILASSVSMDFSIVAFSSSSCVCDRAVCFSASCASREAIR